MLTRPCKVPDSRLFAVGSITTVELESATSSFSSRDPPRKAYEPSTVLKMCGLAPYAANAVATLCQALRPGSGSYGLWGSEFGTTWPMLCTITWGWLPSSVRNLAIASRPLKAA